MSKEFQFISKIGLFVSISLIAVCASIFLIATKGLNFGTDFKGGIKLQYRFASPVSEGDLRDVLEKLDLGDFLVQKIGSAEENRIMIKIEKQEELEVLSKKISEGLQSKLKIDRFVLEQEESVGPKAGKELRKKAGLAIIISWLLILIYIGYRFDFAFAPGAIIALIHDIIITLGCFSLSGREVSLTVVAALLTITGYSVNDTIVLYDRVRENIPKYPTTPLRALINKSINQTLSRTLITSFTLFLAVILIYIFGEGEFQNFGFAMVIGTIVGTYSSIFVASPCYIFTKEKLLPALATKKKK